MPNMDKVRDIIASGIRNYITGIDGETKDAGQVLRRVYDDADTIADYIVSDGFPNAHIVGWITDDPSAIKRPVYTAADAEAWVDRD